MSDSENLSDNESYCTSIAFSKKKLKTLIFCFVFFLFTVLKPVNEYNISDKIESANNQLFDPDNQQHTNGQSNSTTLPHPYRLQTKHRVTFSSDIEEYEDDATSELDDTQYKDDDDEAIDQELIEIIDRSESVMNTTDDKIDGVLRSMSIDEIYSDTTDDNEYPTEIEVAEDIDESSSINNSGEQSVQSEMISIQSFAICGENDVNELPPLDEIDVKVPSSAQAYPKKIPLKNRRAESANAFYGTCRKRHNRNNDDDNILKIHLNVKSCCEHKYLENNRLPRYNGMFSQYGLSKDQLEMREMNRKTFLENRMRRQREIMKAKQEIADLNELAFRQWLIRKNHEAKPKYKNFYDLHEKSK